MSERQEAVPIIHIGGPARERGRDYGRLAKARIEESISIYNAAFDKIGLSEDEVTLLARAIMPRIEAYDESSFEELIGIAEGSGFALEQIIALNARTEMLYSRQEALKKDAEQNLPDGCTGIVVLPEASRDGALLHAQNWDWRVECAKSVVLLHVEGEGKPAFVTFCEAGILARAGLNSAGIALTGNFLRTESDLGETAAGVAGVPIPLLRRRILESGMFAEAIGAVYEAPRAFSCNMMISAAGGEALSLEATPDEVFWLQPENDMLVHANHFQSLAARSKLKDLSPFTTPDSLFRDQRVRRLVAPHHGDIALETINAALHDRFGSPRAICRSPTPGPGGATSATVATILMRPGEGYICVKLTPFAEGSPETEFSLAMEVAQAA